jgi:uncharacterized protein (TIGR02466 family)
MFKDIFPLKIYETFYPNYDSIKDELLEDVMSKFNQETDDHMNHRLFTRGSYTLTGTKPSSIKKLHRQLKNQDLINWINEQIKIYWDGLGYDPKFNPSIYNMWANATGRNDKVLHHNHGSFEITGVFYINATPEMGRLALIHPNEMVLSKCPYYLDQESLQEKWFWDHLVDPQPGKLVLFPGYLYHKTQPNTTDDLRVVMAFSGGGIADTYEKLKNYFENKYANNSTE